MHIAYFTHSLVSCWNHGNAHFLRGLMRELGRMGHDVLALEPADGWSRANLTAEAGIAPLKRFAAEFPDLQVRLYGPEHDVAELIDRADLVIVHEWTDPAIVAALGALRKRGGRFRLLFHDTHHRAATAPQEIGLYDLSGYDGVLAFGLSLAEIYRRQGWGRSAFVLHEAADTTVFQPLDPQGPRKGLVWIGNWGDSERSSELVSFLLRPARTAGLPLDVYGVRYPEGALGALERYGARYHGWLANVDAPPVYAARLATVHVPRRVYREALPGIPTIRVFEALACGIPLLSAPWEDSEGLFRPGADFLVASTEDAMREAMRTVACDGALRRSLTASGLESIRTKHSCRHRALELLDIVKRLDAPALREAV